MRARDRLWLAAPPHLVHPGSMQANDRSPPTSPRSSSGFDLDEAFDRCWAQDLVDADVLFHRSDIGARPVATLPQELLTEEEETVQPFRQFPIHEVKPSDEVVQAAPGISSSLLQHPVTEDPASVMAVEASPNLPDEDPSTVQVETAMVAPSVSLAWDLDSDSDDMLLEAVGLASSSSADIAALPEGTEPDAEHTARPPPLALGPVERLRLRRKRQAEEVREGQQPQHVQAAVAHSPIPSDAPAPAGQLRSFMGISWWTEPLKQAAIAACPKFTEQPERRVIHESLCSGAASEFLGFEALGLSMQLQAAADCSQAARRFMHHAWPQLTHMFGDNSDLHVQNGSTPQSGCKVCNGPCKSPLQRPDMMTGGMPCTPFSRLRCTSGSTVSTGAPHQHPSFPVLFEKLPQYVDMRRPRSFWLEEVETLNRIDRRSGQTYLEAICNKLADLDYDIRVLSLPHADWVELPRTRLFIIATSAETGGAKGADWIVQAIGAMLTARKQQPPTAVWDVISVHDPEEIQRLMIGQDWRQHRGRPVAASKNREARLFLALGSRDSRFLCCLTVGVRVGQPFSRQLNCPKLDYTGQLKCPKLDSTGQFWTIKCPKLDFCLILDN